MLAGLAWGLWFPLNKNLWTSSFALFSAGLAAQILALTHWSRRHEKLARLVAAVRGLRTQPPLLAYFLSVGTDSVLTG